MVVSDCVTVTEKNHDTKFGVPTLEDLGKNEKDCGPCLFKGGETEAIDRMEKMLKKSVCGFLVLFPCKMNVFRGILESSCLFVHHSVHLCTKTLSVKVLVGAISSLPHNPDFQRP